MGRTRGGHRAEDADKDHANDDDDDDDDNQFPGKHFDINI